MELTARFEQYPYHLYVKKDGEWVEVQPFKKVDGEWVEQRYFENLFKEGEWIKNGDNT